MALNESNVEKHNEYLEIKYSSGDSNTIKSKQYQEENNNNINELSKDLSEMGCIVDAVKRPPNICIETCVYEETDSDKNNERLNNDSNNANTRISNNDNNVSNNDEDIYSDEFDEESNSDIDETNIQNKTALSKSISGLKIDKSSLKLSKSCSSTFSKPASTARSSDFGSIPSTRRKNMSFSNDKLRSIERQNHILLNKILSARNNKKSSIPSRDQPVWKPTPPAAVHRKVQQRKIDHDNMILLKKIQRAKSSMCSVRR